MLINVPAIVTAKSGPDTAARNTRHPTMVVTSMQMFGMAVTACDSDRTSSVRVAISRCIPSRSRCSSGAETTLELNLPRSW